MTPFVIAKLNEIESLANRNIQFQNNKYEKFQCRYIKTFP